MKREKAWTHYFTTGEREPLVEAYWDSIQYLAWAKFPHQKDDAFQAGMIGLLGAIKKIDRNRVKSKDAWVWLNVKSMIYKIQQAKPTVSLDATLDEFGDKTYVDNLATNDETDFDLLLKDLPARQRLILSLIYRHDWHKTEIGNMLGISSMRVGQIEQQALSKLRTGGEVVNASL